MAAIEDLPDPNALYSTIVQTSAAFIAIVAGLVVGLLLSRAADKQSADNRIHERRATLDTLRKQQIEAQAESDRARAIYAWNWNLDEAMNGEDLRTYEDARTRIRTEGAPDNAMAVEWVSLVQDLQAAKAFLADFVEAQKKAGCLETLIYHQRQWEGFVSARRAHVSERIESIATYLHDLRCKAQSEETERRLSAREALYRIPGFHYPTYASADIEDHTALRCYPESSLTWRTLR